MELIVVPHGTDITRGHLQVGPRLYDCALGRGGVSATKREGDGSTPAGRFPLRHVMYRPDRLLAPPQTTLPLKPISRTDGWCTSPEDAAYNQAVTLPYSASAEALWREDSLYNIVVVLGHNEPPATPGAGSAIFLHVAAPGFEATEGCVAIKQGDLLELLSKVRPETCLDIRLVLKG